MVVWALVVGWCPWLPGSDWALCCGIWVDLRLRAVPLAFLSCAPCSAQALPNQFGAFGHVVAEASPVSEACFCEDVPTSCGGRGTDGAMERLWWGEGKGRGKGQAVGRCWKHSQYPSSTCTNPSPRGMSSRTSCSDKSLRWYCEPSIADALGHEVRNVLQRSRDWSVRGCGLCPVPG